MTSLGGCRSVEGIVLMSDPLDEINRGDNAERLLRNPLIAEAFDLIRSEYIAAWEGAPARDVEGRERIWAHLQSLAKVRAHLETVVYTGKMSKKQQEELRGRRRFF
jgi:hypothetical protein